jgi:glycosyltransferase involved in cell wall biosynthesis
MKIVHVFKDFYPPLAAGITCYIADISDAAARRGHEVEVHVAGVRRSRRDRLASGVIVHRHRELGRALSMPLAPGLIREVRQLRADVLHVHLPNPIGELGAALNSAAPTVCSFHAQLVRQRVLEPVYRPLRDHLLARTACVMVSSAAMAAVPELARHARKTRVVPYGVSPRLTTQRRVTEAPADAMRLLFVGRLVYYKGVDVLLHAMVRSTATLRIVGDGADRKQLEQLSVGLGVQDRVQFLGSISDAALADAYATADAIVLPSTSRAEAFGLAMVEAMACGVPAISTSLGTGTDFVNVDGETGLVVRPGDTEDLVRAIDRLRDADLRATLGAAAARRVGSLFSFDTHVDALMDIYERAAQ